MGKKFSNILKGEILSSIFYVVFGLCLILIPDQTVNLICKVIFGLIMIVAGIYHIGIYVMEKEKATILDLFTGVITAVLGIFLFFTPQIVIKLLPYLLGAFVLVDCIWKFKGAYRLRKIESDLDKILFIGTLLFAALGVVILLYPFGTVSKMILFCGCILTVNGAADVIFLIMMRTVLKKTEKLSMKKEDQEKEDQEKGDQKKDKKKFWRRKKKSTAKASIELESEEMSEQDVSEEGSVQYWELDEKETEIEKRSEDVSQDECYRSDEEMESPRKEIQEMLRNHDEPLEEWKD